MEKHEKLIEFITEMSSLSEIIDAIEKTRISKEMIKKYLDRFLGNNTILGRSSDNNEGFLNLIKKAEERATELEKSMRNENNKTKNQTFINNFIKGYIFLLVYEEIDMSANSIEEIETITEESLRTKLFNIFFSRESKKKERFVADIIPRLFYDYNEKDVISYRNKENIEKDISFKELTDITVEEFMEKYLFLNNTAPSFILENGRMKELSDSLNSVSSNSADREILEFLNLIHERTINY